MGDTSKQRSGPQVISHSANLSQNTTSSHSSQSFSPCANLEAQVLAVPSPISSAKDARLWLENKGWMLNSEENSNFKLADILFMASLAFKLPADACTAVRSVAFLLRTHADETLSTTVSDLIIDKMINKFSEPLARLNNSITATKMFLDAAAQKQASGLLNLQDLINQHEATAKSLADSADKLSHAPNPGALDDDAWPRLSARPSAATLNPPPGAQVPAGSHQANPKVVQRGALAAKQLLIEYGPLEAGEESPPQHSRSPKGYAEAV